MSTVLPGEASDLERWEADGGAGAPPSVPQLALGPTDTERRVLQSLGAAVVGGWNDLPTYIQRTLFRLAAGGANYRPARKAHIARFLHYNKGAADAR